MGIRRIVFAVLLLCFAVLGILRTEPTGPVRASHSAPQVLRDEQHDVSPPLREMVRRVHSGAPRMTRPEDAEEENFTRAAISSPVPPLFPDPVLQLHSETAFSGSTLLNFDGIGENNNWIAPDTNGAVGATQFVEWVNVEFSVYDKTTGSLVLGPVAGNTLWGGFGGACETSNSGDVIAEYDKLAAAG